MKTHCRSGASSPSKDFQKTWTWEGAVARMLGRPMPQRATCAPSRTPRASWFRVCTPGLARITMREA